jgi:hypothetical protein
LRGFFNAHSAAVILKERVGEMRKKRRIEKEGRREW